VTSEHRVKASRTGSRGPPGKLDQVPTLSKEGLFQLLVAANDPVANECAAAMMGGSKVNIWESWRSPASHLATVYRYRAGLIPSSLDVQGMERTLRSFETAKDEPIEFAHIAQGIGQPEYSSS
jgi:hypothetical protein